MDGRLFEFNVMPFGSIYAPSTFHMRSKHISYGPAHMRSQIMQDYHDSTLSGHRGFETSLNNIRNRFFWNYMPSQIQTYC
jgi:hypothetical protein